MPVDSGMGTYQRSRGASPLVDRNQRPILSNSSTIKQRMSAHNKKQKMSHSPSLELLSHLTNYPAMTALRHDDRAEQGRFRPVAGPPGSGIPCDSSPDLGEVEDHSDGNVQHNNNDTAKFALLNTNKRSPKIVWNVLHKRLPPAQLAGIVSIRFNDKRRIFEITMKKSVLSNLKHNMGLSYRARQHLKKARNMMDPETYGINTLPWRLEAWSNDKHKELVTQNKRLHTIHNDQITSWNAAGLKGKEATLLNLISSHGPAIVAIQETLQPNSDYPTAVSGYKTFNKPKTNGFQGQLLLVDRRLNSYETDHWTTILPHKSS